MVAVLDASAFLALIHKEPGGAHVVEYLPRALMSAANYAEVLHALARTGIEIELARNLVAALRIEVVPLTADIAAGVASLGVAGSPSGLSLGDRACLATAAEFGVPVVTADRVWSKVDLGVHVICIR